MKRRFELISENQTTINKEKTMDFVMSKSLDASSTPLFVCETLKKLHSLKE